MKYSDFFNYLFIDNNLRTKRRRNLSSDIFAYDENLELRAKYEIDLIEKYYAEDFPVVFIIGVPRSGTTLFSQLMVSTLEVGYINKFVSRFWMCPIYGLVRFKMSNHKEEFDFDSFLGSNDSSASPHEFGWFWQWWFLHQEHDQLGDKGLDQINWVELNKQIMGLAGFFQAPLIFKNLNYTNFKIPSLHSNIRNARFIWIRRDEVFVIDSILRSRVKQYGSKDIWWSIKPANYEEQLTRPPLEQVISQVTEVTDGIKDGLNLIPKEYVQIIDYSDLIESPEIIMKKISLWLNIEFRQDPSQIVRGIRRPKPILEENLKSILKTLEHNK